VAVEIVSGHHAPYLSGRKSSPRSCGPSCGSWSDGPAAGQRGQPLLPDRRDGAPTVLIHGCGGWALGFADAVTELAKLGRVTAYDRRGCALSERPEPDKRTSVAEHTDDAAALLDALDATPAIVTGRSYGGTIAADLALRSPDRVRAAVMLEPDAPRELVPKAAEWIDALAESLRESAAPDGTDAVGHALITRWRAKTQGAHFPTSGNGSSPRTGQRFRRAGRGVVAGGRRGGTRQHQPTRRCSWRSRIASRVPRADQRLRRRACECSNRTRRRRPHHRSGGAGGDRLHRGTA
jgi:pimeloyl-ACP methyl ester carboxylesterase